MGKKLAIDFGNSNTTVAVWNESLEREELIKIQDITRRYKNPKGHSDSGTYCIPSIINFEGNNVLIGQEVFYRGKEFHQGTFRDIKRYIMKRKSLPKDMEAADYPFMKQEKNLCQN